MKKITRRSFLAAAGVSAAALALTACGGSSNSAKWLKYVKNKTKCKKHTMEKMWEKERKNV